MSSVNIIKEKSISIVNSCVDIASKYDFSKTKELLEAKKTSFLISRLMLP